MAQLSVEPVKKVSKEEEYIPPDATQSDVTVLLFPQVITEIEVVVAGLYKRAHSTPASAAYTA